jgi:hypothetical protein
MGFRETAGGGGDTVTIADVARLFRSTKDVVQTPRDLIRP